MSEITKQFAPSYIYQYGGNQKMQLPWNSVGSVKYNVPQITGTKRNSVTYV
jgi:hypothetical protein